MMALVNIMLRAAQNSGAEINAADDRMEPGSAGGGIYSDFLLLNCPAPPQSDGVERKKSIEYVLSVIIMLQY